MSQADGGPSTQRTSSSPWLSPSIWIASRYWLPVGLILVLFAYLPSLGGPFFTDDFTYLAANEALQALPLSETWRLFERPFNPFEFLPLRDLSYRIDLALWDLSPSLSRLKNLVLYVGVCIAAWVCTTQLLGALRGAAVSRAEGARRKVASVFTSILFAVHPAHVEGVIWISGRKDLLSSLFALLSISCFARAISSRQPRLGSVLGSALLFLCALASKATVVGLTPLFFVLPYSTLHQDAPLWTRLRAAATIGLPFLIVGGWWAALTLKVAKATKVAAIESLQVQSSFDTMAETAATILGYLARIVLLPIRQRLFYDVAEPGWPLFVAKSLGIVVLVFAVVGLVSFVRRRSVSGVGIVWFLLLALPHLQLVPFRTWSLASERFVFLALFGPVLALAWWLSAPSRRRLGTVVCLLLFSAGLAATKSYASLWTEPERLVEVSAARSPASGSAQRVLIENHLLPSGRYDEALVAAGKVRQALTQESLERLVRATRALEAGDLQLAEAEARNLRHLTASPRVMMLLGHLAELRQDDVEACRWYFNARGAANIESDQRAAETSLARVRRRHASQLEQLRETVRLNPGDLVADGRLANAELQLFLLDDAEQRFRRLVESFPSSAAASYNLGITLLRQRKFSEAERWIQTGIGLGLTTADAWNNLGIARLRRGALASAERTFRRAIGRGGDTCDPSMNLARLLLVDERLEEARSAFRAARESHCRGEKAGLADLYLRQIQLPDAV